MKTCNFSKYIYVVHNSLRKTLHGLRQYTTFKLPKIEWLIYLHCGEGAIWKSWMDWNKIINLYVGEVGTQCWNQQISCEQNCQIIVKLHCTMHHYIDPPTAIFSIFKPNATMLQQTLKLINLILFYIWQCMNVACIVIVIVYKQTNKCNNYHLTERTHVLRRPYSSNTYHQPVQPYFILFYLYPSNWRSIDLKIDTFGLKIYCQWWNKSEVILKHWDWNLSFNHSQCYNN